MILANLAKAIREQNYYAVVLEFLIVIAGVVIGFQIQAWNENRLEQARHDQVLLRLHEEVQQANGFFLRTTGIYDRINSARTEAIERLLANDFEGADLEELTNGVTSTSLLPGANPPESVYEEIINSGLVSTIGDDELRDALARYASSIRFLRSQIDYLRQLILIRPTSYDFEFVQIVYAPGTARERTFEVDFEAAAQSEEFMDHLLIGNNSMRAMADWWHSSLRAVEGLCQETTRITEQPCIPSQMDW